MIVYIKKAELNSAVVTEVELLLCTVRVMLKLRMKWRLFVPFRPVSYNKFRASPF